jgi:hypothetical protein
VARSRPRIIGVDFTSKPRRAKPITVALCALRDSTLLLAELVSLDDFEGFERLLATRGPWVGGFDFPFGLPRAAISALNWPLTWPEMVLHCASLGRTAFTRASDRLRSGRPVGNKYPKRRGDDYARSHSPMKCVRPPVGWMFLEGAPRLLKAGVEIPGLHRGDPSRVAVEAYPGLFARALIGYRSYKNDSPAKQNAGRKTVRKLIWTRMTRGDNPLNITVRASASAAGRILADGTGDFLDAVICAMQAAWAWQHRNDRYGLPAELDPLEGWIVSA